MTFQYWCCDLDTAGVHFLFLNVNNLRSILHDTLPLRGFKSAYYMHFTYPLLMSKREGCLLALFAEGTIPAQNGLDTQPMWRNWPELSSQDRHDLSVSTTRN